MGSISKSFSLLLVVILAVSSLIMVESAFAQTPKPSPVPIPTPSVPELTVKFVDRSYTVEESSQINPYTGKTEVIPAHRVQNYTIELTIKNQPIASAMVGDFNAEFRYDVNAKGHFAQNWTIMYFRFEGPKPSNSDHTIITYELVSSPTHPEQGFELTRFFDNPVGSNTIMGIPPNSQLDFRVRAMYGAMHRSYNPNATDQLSMYPWVFEGATSDWSNTQTVTIPETSASPSPSPNPTPTPTVPEVSLWTIPLLLTITLALAGLLVYNKKHKHILVPIDSSSIAKNGKIINIINWNLRNHY
jgi:hypothetical protein